MILLIEDEPDAQEAEVAYLKRAGYGVITAATGLAGIKAFESYSIELVVTDINLPDMQGIVVCKHIREMSDVPIIIVTALTSDMDELLGLESGADDYVRKPFNPQLLVARIQTLLKRTGSRAIRRGDVEINPINMLCTKIGQEVRLTTTQFNILYKLMERPGAVLTRRQLISAAKHDDYGDAAVLDRTVDAHIKSIRKSLEDDPAHPVFIKTIIGRGYCYEVPTAL